MLLKGAVINIIVKSNIYQSDAWFPKGFLQNHCNTKRKQSNIKNNTSSIFNVTIISNAFDSTKSIENIFLAIQQNSEIIIL